MEFHTALKRAMECMGISDMKPKQIDAIKSFVSGRDTFVTLPTGYGKSIIFAILPLLFNFLRGEYAYLLYCLYIKFYTGTEGSIAVVVTPLISLMMDQGNKFTLRGIKTEFVGDAQRCEQAVEAVINQLVYISPESLLQNRRY